MIKRIQTSENIDRLVELFDAYRVFYEKESDPERGYKFIKNRIDNNESVIFVSVNEKDELTGFTQLYPLFSSTRMCGIWLLNDLYVNKKYRGEGYSKELINAAKGHCRKTEYAGILLETTTDNTVANQLYINTDFNLDKSHNYYFWEKQ